MAAATTAAATVVIIAALFLITVPGGIAQSPAAAPQPAELDCSTYIYNMSDCLTYVEPGSNLTKPDKDCCPELASLVDNQPICLCKLLANSTDIVGMPINVTKALNLPSVCKVTTPDASACSVLGYPIAGYPVGAPTSSEGPGIMPPAASNPASGNNGNGASSIAFSHLSFVVGLAIAFLTTHFQF
uniref:Putative non-specific lipid transfer protein GPI-anchored 2 n=1 Tax=Davidia involucrata TaxID=16924 RepID=A0A5B7AHM1_DAVIN